MENRDYLTGQIEQLGLVLRRLFSKLLALKDSGMESAVVVNQIMTEELGWDIDGSKAIPDDRWIDTLLNEKRYNPENLEKLADLLLWIAENDLTDEQESLYRRSLTIYRHLETSEKTYSFERNAKMDKIVFLLER